MPNIFQAARAAVPVPAAAERYGLQVRRGGMVCCPFHEDRHPSMKIYDDHYYCFGCQAHGDVTDLTHGCWGCSPMKRPPDWRKTSDCLPPWGRGIRRIPSFYHHLRSCAVEMVTYTQ